MQKNKKEDRHNCVGPLFLQILAAALSAALFGVRAADTATAFFLFVDVADRRAENQRNDEDNDEVGHGKYSFLTLR